MNKRATLPGPESIFPAAAPATKVVEPVKLPAETEPETEKNGVATQQSGGVITPKRNSNKIPKDSSAEETVVGVSVRADFYISEEAADLLEEEWLRRRRKPNRKISKSRLVDKILRGVLADATLKEKILGS